MAIIYIEATDEGILIAGEQLRGSGIDHEEIKKLAEFFPSGEVIKTKLHDIDISPETIKKFEELARKGAKVSRVPLHLK